MDEDKAYRIKCAFEKYNSLTMELLDFSRTLLVLEQDCGDDGNMHSVAYLRVYDASSSVSEAYDSMFAGRQLLREAVEFAKEENNDQCS